MTKTTSNDVRNILKTLADDAEALMKAVPKAGEAPAVPDLPPFTIEAKNFNGIKHLLMGCKLKIENTERQTLYPFEFTAIVTPSRATYRVKGRVHVSAYTTYPKIEILEEGKEHIGVWIDRAKNIASPYPRVSKRVLSTLNLALEDIFIGEWNSSSLEPYREAVRQYSIHKLRQDIAKSIGDSVSSIIRHQICILSDIDALEHIEQNS